MNRKTKIPLILLLIFSAGIFSGSLMGQSSRVKKADNFRALLAYSKAAKLYEDELRKNPEAKDITSTQEKLAACYEELGRTEDAEKVYKDLANTGGAKAAHKYRYALMLKQNGKYPEAKTVFDGLTGDGTYGKMAKAQSQACEYAIAGSQEKDRYKIQPQPFNIAQSDFGPTPMGGGLLITSARKRAFFTRAVDARSGSLFYDLYYVERTTKKKGYKIEALKGKVNTRFHEGPGVLSPDGKTLYFTRSNYFEGKRKKDTKGINNLKIFTAELQGKKWKNIQGMPFNNNEFSSGHPAISPDGKTLVFASNRPGSKGGSDLYMVQKTEKGWTEPKNLGSEINTAGDELFPSIDKNGNLYFASDGHPGFGGLDVFSSVKAKNGWGKPQNAGYPLNSSKDDFGVSLLKNSAKGYFSSDRAGGAGSDDIYYFTRKMKFEGYIVDQKTKEPIPGASVVIQTGSGRKSKLNVDENGYFSQMTDWGRDIFLSIEAEDYLPKREKINTRLVGPLQDLRVRIELERNIRFAAKGTVRDKETGKAIPNPTVRVTYKNTGNKTKGKPDGTFFIPLEEETEYTIILSARGYRPAFLDLSTVGLEEAKDFIQDVELEKGDYVMVEGITKEKGTNTPIGNAKIAAFDMDSIARLNTRSARTDGHYFMMVPPDKPEFVLASHEGYFVGRIDFPEEMDSTWSDTTLNMDIEMVKYEVGAIVKVIYYDLDKSLIRRKSGEDLLEIVYFLENNPSASVELSSHTDSRASDRYNQKLSERRSQSAVDYIVKQGIEAKRIMAKGYGEKKLVNRCSNGVKCSKEEHQANRRTEIQVTEIDNSMGRSGIYRFGPERKHPQESGSQPDVWQDTESFPEETTPPVNVDAPLK